MIPRATPTDSPATEYEGPLGATGAFPLFDGAVPVTAGSRGSDNAGEIDPERGAEGYIVSKALSIAWARAARVTGALITASA